MTQPAEKLKLPVPQELCGRLEILIPVADLPLRTPVKNSLEEYGGMSFLGNIITTGERHLRFLPEIGRKTVIDINQILRRLRLEPLSAEGYEEKAPSDHLDMSWRQCVEARVRLSFGLEDNVTAPVFSEIAIPVADLPPEPVPVKPSPKIIEPARMRVTSDGSRITLTFDVSAGLREGVAELAKTQEGRKAFMQSFIKAGKDVARIVRDYAKPADPEN